MTDSESTNVGALPGARILIVDDERALRRTLAIKFGHMGYRVTEAGSGREALEHIGRQNFDLVILDLKMPGMDGAEVLQTARPLAPDTVFIILTAYGTLDSAIAGIRHGAFDYLLKPSPIEDIVRVVQDGLAERQRRQQSQDPVTLLERALVSLKAAPQPPEGATEDDSAKRFLQAPGITVDTLKQLVVVQGQPVDLTPTEFEILAYLLRHQNRIVSCRKLVSHTRGYDLDERDARALLHSHVHRLRHKLERDSDQPRLIHTVRGSGYTISTQAAET